MNKLQDALKHPIWLSHKISDKYTMDNKCDLWKLTYYPIFTNNKTKEVYNESRALIEKPINGGIDFREVPLRYLNKIL